MSDRADMRAARPNSPENTDIEHRESTPFMLSGRPVTDDARCARGA